ncbi:M56 family metallopeptidase [Psychroflexus sp. ALD_RP9]|uniref:M56 family metallopeptidase n=1 Tax=Psychroflexus sp. ALD_RP9 TaxID=2777186 RepID=UPI001A8C7455|nr:M56 family metallopeptidase [Psychroflexus sp. ALD_RP9]QSS96246.1 energy transducer TonB [Psychroflexus sp. ALD_RP9]
MLKYLLDVLVLQALFLIAFQAIKQSRLFQLNRLFLLLSIGLSILLPLLSFKWLTAIFETPALNFELQIGELSTMFIDNTSTVTQIDTSAVAQKSKMQWSWLQIIVTIVGSISLLKLILLRYKFRKIQKVLSTARFMCYDHDCEIYSLPHSTEAFSFLKKVYIGSDFSEAQFKHILAHEKIHAQSLHSLDVLLIEFCSAIFWFNPFWYWYKSEFALLHEYEADAKASKLSSVNAYFQSLLNVSFGTQNLKFVNHFFNQSILKKRIIMLQQSNKNQFKAIKYLWLLPALLLSLTYLSCTEDSVKDDVLQQQIHQEEAEVYRAKFQKIIDARLAEGQTIFEIMQSDEFDIEHNDTKTKEEFYKSQVIMKNLMTVVYEEKPDGEARLAEMQEMFTQTYEDYLKSKKDKQTYTVETEYVEDTEHTKGLDVGFMHVNQAPYFETCEGLVSNKETKQCVSQFISDFVSKKAIEVGLIQTAKNLGFQDIQRVYVQFKINTLGEIVNVKARAPHPDLQQKAETIIKQLPDMIPGEHHGEVVNVVYSLPITFKI